MLPHATIGALSYFKETGMRIALISDIHGNNVALEAVLEDINKQKVDSIICLGDVSSLGPQPNEVLDKIREMNCPCVLGNHESAMLNPANALDYHIAEHLHSTLEWGINKLSQDDLNYFRSLPKTLEVQLDAQHILLCYHGSPYSNVDNLLPETPLNQLGKYLNGQSAQIMAGGHTHFQMLRQFEGRLVINPGSVGSAFLTPPLSPRPTLLPWAEYSLVDYAGHTIKVDLRRVAFDIDAFLKVLAKSNIPLKDWWREQYTSPRAKW